MSGFNPTDDVLASAYVFILERRRARQAREEQERSNAKAAANEAPAKPDRNETLGQVYAILIDEFVRLKVEEAREAVSDKSGTGNEPN